MSSNMLDARREARRRKILENSEKRLNRITGRSDLKENADKLDVEENGFVNITDEMLLNGERNHDTENTSAFSFSKLTNTSFSSESLDSEAFNYISRGAEVNDEISSLHNRTNISYQTSHIIHITLAILFRLLIECNGHYICGNSMVVAYLLTKCGLLCINGVLIPETSRLLGSLLLMSGIHPQRIKLFTICISTVYCVLKDFALYIFVFVFSDLLITAFKQLLSRKQLT